MRGRVLAVSIVIAIVLAGASASHSSGRLTVRPVRTPAEAAEAARHGLPPRAVMTPTEAKELELRLGRWRSFPHHLSTPRVDWSPRANRRRGWVAPAAPLRNPHLRPGADPAGSGSTTLGAAPSETLRIAFLRVDFAADRGGDASSGTGRFDLSGPDTLVPAIDRPPHNRAFYLGHLEALRRFYDVQSYGTVLIEGDVWPRDPNGAYTMSDMADFGPWKFSPDIFGAAVHMFRTMLFAADSQSIARGDRIPWDSYDRFMIIHAGSDLQSDLRADSPEDIPSFTLGVDDTDRVIFPDSLDRPLDRAAIVPETANQDGFFGALNGVIAHENGHNFFGYADLYNVETGFPVVGLWSLMDSGNLAGTRVQLPNGDIIFAVGMLPPSVDPFQRFFAGTGLTFREPTWGDTIPIRDGERHPDMRQVFLSSDEYLLLENRWIRPTPGDILELDQDSTTRVILGPTDRFEYDALVPGPGLLVWHIDASVIPFETAFRINPDYGFNTDPARYGISVIEADKLADLGDPGSPYILGSPLDPYFASNNPSLSDTTKPNLRPHIKTRPHLRLDFLDEPDSVMRVHFVRRWQPSGWPVAADVPPGGPQLLAVDADGDRKLEVCWAGGGVDSPDSTALFAVRANGTGMFGASHVFATLDRRPRPLMAALATSAEIDRGPALFAVSTYADRPDTLGVVAGGGQVWMFDHFGNALAGWPAALPSLVSTPPVIAGGYPNSKVFVGCEDGGVYQLDLAGTVEGAVLRLPGPVSGRLAVMPTLSGFLGAAGDRLGNVGVWPPVVCPADCLTWPLAVGGPGFEPDFLWIDFDDGHPASGQPVCSGDPTLVIHNADRLMAFCPRSASALPGWAQPAGDTIAAGLGAGDPDGDGYVEVLTQSKDSGVAFWNQSGRPSPGWPKRTSVEPFRTDSPPLAVDVTGDGRAEVVAMNASGILTALDAAGRVPDGWPLATGTGAAGGGLAADLDRDGSLEIVMPDRALADSIQFGVNGRFETLWAYSIPVGIGNPQVTSWTMVGGDPGRTSALPASRTPVAPAASAGPLVAGSLKAYPNPARRKPVSFAYQLSEPAEVEFRILDASGHEVASFTRQGRQTDNVEVWDPGAAPAGLYLARLRFKTGSREESHIVTLGVVR